MLATLGGPGNNKPNRLTFWAAPPMLPGFNHNLRYGDRLFHVQTEDNGESQARLVTQIFISGQLVAIERGSYQDVLDAGLEEKAQTDRIRERMQEQHKAQMKRLVSGALDDRIASLFSVADAAEAKTGKTRIKAEISNAAESLPIALAEAALPQETSPPTRTPAAPPQSTAPAATPGQSTEIAATPAQSTAPAAAHTQRTAPAAAPPRGAEPPTLAAPPAQTKFAPPAERPIPSALGASSPVQSPQANPEAPVDDLVSANRSAPDFLLELDAEMLRQERWSPTDAQLQEGDRFARGAERSPSEVSDPEDASRRGARRRARAPAPAEPTPSLPPPPIARSRRARPDGQQSSRHLPSRIPRSTSPARKGPTSGWDVPIAPPPRTPNPAADLTGPMAPRPPARNAPLAGAPLRHRPKPAQPRDPDEPSTPRQALDSRVPPLKPSFGRERGAGGGAPAQGPASANEPEAFRARAVPERAGEARRRPPRQAGIAASDTLVDMEMPAALKASIARRQRDAVQAKNIPGDQVPKVRGHVPAGAAMRPGLPVAPRQPAPRPETPALPGRAPSTSAGLAGDASATLLDVDATELRARLAAHRQQMAENQPSPRRPSSSRAGRESDSTGEARGNILVVEPSLDDVILGYLSDDEE